MSLPEIVSRAEWQAASERLLTQEKAATRTLDALAAQRRRLPMVRFGQDYVFDTPDGKAGLLDLFEGRRQLVVYQFMDSGPDDYCPGCSTFTDNIGRLEHLHARDVTFVVLSNMPLPQITAFKERMDWTVPFYSSHGTSFSHDCGAGDGFGISVFLRDGADIFQTYFATRRAGDRLRFDFNILDLTPLGRQEEWEDSPAGWPQTPAYSWWRLHDEYPKSTDSTKRERRP